MNGTKRKEIKENVRKHLNRTSETCERDVGFDARESVNVGKSNRSSHELFDDKETTSGGVWRRYLVEE